MLYRALSTGSPRYAQVRRTSRREQTVPDRTSGRLRAIGCAILHIAIFQGGLAWYWQMVFYELLPVPHAGVLCGACVNLHDPEHWRRRANEMRRIADGLGVLALAKASVLRTAGEYDLLAARAERRLNSK
jgi:hypothetical protein